MYPKTIGAVVGITCAAMSVAFAPPAAAQPLDNPGVVAPDADPFYAVPGDLAGLANGAILDSRPISASAGPVPLSTRAWQVKYKTLDTHDRPTATVATVLVPTAPWTGPGPRPLVSLQSAEDGVGLRCAPSLTLRGGGLLGGSLTDIVVQLPKLIERGWGVVVPDWEGPDSAFGSAPMAAHGVLDGIRAARAFEPAGFAADTPIGLWGYSGGGFASIVAAQFQPSYAPELSFAGIAAGGAPGDERAVYHAANGGPFGGAVPVLFVGISRGFPEARLESYLNDTGRRIVAESQTDCLPDAGARNPGLDFGDSLNAEGVEKLMSLLWSNSPLAQPGVPESPMYLYHAVGDELVVYPPAKALVERLCAAGVTVEHRADPGGEHLVEGALGADGAVDFLADRFAGRDAPSTC
ncbi:lipase family protein [Nocardia sp. NPDC005825]|uniref:lipase family protein n=1 Tax=unclassified Nocardia TaxID=2637762 RepID=UPI0033D7BB90